MLTASIVLFNTSSMLVSSILNDIQKANIVDVLYIIDNSPEKHSEFYSAYPNTEYIPHDNTGYGSSHNIAIKKAIEKGSTYHIVLNLDIKFEKNILPYLVEFMDKNQDCVYVLPKVTYPNGELQYLCKLLPNPADLIFRRFLPKNKFTQKIDDKYVLKQSGYNKIINPPCLSGCFMFMRISALKDNNIFFDDRFFMYCEDFDLIRRLHRIGKTLFLPDVTIIHDHAKASYKSKKNANRAYKISNQIFQQIWLVL